MLKKILKKELGQAMVEYVLTVPIFFMLVFAIIDIGWYGYQRIMFDYSYQLASWEMSVSDPNIDTERDISGDDAEKYIRNAISSTAVGINMDNMQFVQPHILLWKEEIQYINPLGGKSTEKRRYMEIIAHIEYKFKPFTIIGKTILGNTVTLTKDLDRLRLLQAKR